MSRSDPGKLIFAAYILIFFREPGDYTSHTQYISEISLGKRNSIVAITNYLEYFPWLLQFIVSSINRICLRYLKPV